MQNDEIVIFGGASQFRHQRAPRRKDVLEVGRFAGEALPVAGVVGVLATPKVGGVGDEGVGGFDGRQAFRCRADEVGGAPGGGGVLQGVAGTPLGGVRADGEYVARHAARHKADSGLHGFCAGFAGEFPIAGLGVGDGANRLGDDGAGRFDGVGVAFAPHPHRADVTRVNGGACQGVACRFDGDGGGVLVQPGDGFLRNRQAAVPRRPHAGNLLRRNAVAGNVGAVADDSGGGGGFHHKFKVSGFKFQVSGSKFQVQSCGLRV